MGLDLGRPTSWLLECLGSAMALRPGMRVLDLVCGRAGGVVCLAKEFDLQAWAADPWIRSTENWARNGRHGLEQHGFPQECSDAILVTSSMRFFASEYLYLGRRLIPFVMPCGQLGADCPGFERELGGDLPANRPAQLACDRDSCAPHAWHSAGGLGGHWAKNGQAEVLLAGSFPVDKGHRTYLRREQISGHAEKPAADEAGRSIAFIRLAAQRRGKA